MSMKIIILKGGTNKDKIAVMNAVFVALHINRGKKKSFTSVQSPSGMDFQADFDYTVNGKKQKVAMYSKDDTLANCNMVINKYSQLKMDTLIIAFSKEETDLYIPTNAKYVIVKKTGININDCRKIISLI